MLGDDLCGDVAGVDGSSGEAVSVGRTVDSTLGSAPHADSSSAATATMAPLDIDMDLLMTSPRSTVPVAASLHHPSGG